jgi:glycosyltransferase involved in cell wall biosynthesis
MKNSNAPRQLNIACIGTRGVPSNYSGIETACEGLYSALANLGHKITVYCRSETNSQETDYYRGIRRIAMPAIRTRSLESLSHNAVCLSHAAIQRDYDIVHVHALAPGCFVPVCRFTKARLVSTVHGLDWQRAKWKGVGSKLLRFGERSLVRHADQMIVVSQDLQRYYNLSYGRSTVHIPNGVEELANDDRNDQDTLGLYGLQPSEYILFLGRLVPEKRVEDLIVAYRFVPGNRKLVIAGDNSSHDGYITNLQALANEDSRVLFTGAQKRTAVHALFRNAALFVNPSELEGLPMTVLECIQHGTPVLASDIPSHRELLGGDHRYDLFFAHGNADSLRRGIDAALASIEYYRRLIASKRTVLLRDHSWAAIAKRTEDVYRAALSLSVEEVQQVKTAVRTPTMSSLP